jgi:hypothetical protein
MENLQFKYKKNTSSDIEVSVKTPYYSKDENDKVFYKVLNSQGDYIQVNTYSFNTGVNFRSFDFVSSIPFDDTVEATEEDFINSLKMV